MLSELLIHCVLGPTQPPVLDKQDMEWAVSNISVIVWRPTVWSTVTSAPCTKHPIGTHSMTRYKAEHNHSLSPIVWYIVRYFKVLLVYVYLDSNYTTVSWVTFVLVWLTLLLIFVVCASASDCRSFRRRSSRQCVQRDVKPYLLSLGGLQSGECCKPSSGVWGI